MEKIKVGIVGYGNLGKVLEKEINKSNLFELVAVFSKRIINKCVNYNQIKNYQNKIDILFLAVGSQSNLEEDAQELIKMFNIIECYDNHSKLELHISNLDNLAKQNNKIALCAFGWDPGIFSLMRGLCDSMGYSATTVWGKGISQGHTQAIKRLPHVKDALQFTIPNRKMCKKVAGGGLINANKLHKRKCYVVCNKEYQKQIKAQIVSMPHYFKDYKTKVRFVSLKKLKKLKTFSHKGTIFTENNIMNFTLKLPSNPTFTAKTMIAFALNYKKLLETKTYGAFTIFDLPFNNILTKSKFSYL